LRRRAVVRLLFCVSALCLAGAIFPLLRDHGSPSPVSTAARARARSPAGPLPPPGPGELEALVERIGSDMRPVRGGRFVTDETALPTTVGGFSLCAHEATFEEIDAFAAAEGRTPTGDRGWGRDRRPGLYMSWYDALEFCNWLSRQAGLQPCYTIDFGRRDPRNTCRHDENGWLVLWNRDADGYRLPTEAEWEYAAQGGALGRDLRYPGGSDPRTVAWFLDNSRGMTHAVGLKLPNELGVFDMGGNVWEWVWDWFGPDAGPNEDPIGPDGGSARVIRGGSWFFDARGVEHGFRKTANPASRLSWVGFRVARNHGPAGKGDGW
jgi:sulfatase modifying factor 1